MKSYTLLSALVALCLACAMPGASSEGAPTKAFDSRPWQQDFNQLLAALSEHYANLEWAVDGRHMDLVKLRESTQVKLDQAHNDEDARVILDKFVDAFGDGHLEIDWPVLAASGTEAPSGSSGNLCQRLGYSSQDNRPGIDFTQLPQFSPVPGEEATLFPGGLLPVSNGRKLGIIRIGLFAERGFPVACTAAVRALKLTDAKACDDTCEDRVLAYAADYLTAALGRRADVLKQAGATSLLVDITGNGGGTNWVEAAARELSPLPLHESRYAFVRHPHWTSDLQGRLKDVESDLQKKRGPKDVLEKARAQLMAAIQQTGKTCDRSAVWQENRLHCSQLVTGALYTSGILDYAAPGSYDGLDSRSVLYGPLQYAYSESPARPSVYVLVDRNTWSAAEYFAAILQDNHAGTIIGELTGGAGCGYTNGGIATILKYSGATVKIPDCVRIRPDGSDAVDGVVPDLLLPWAKRDTGYQRVQKLMTELQSLH